MSTTVKFENRVRFNWGFHDAVQCVREGWTENGRCFAPGSVLADCVTPEQVLAKHFDPSYAHGWAHGYRAAKANAPTVSSASAWRAALARGEVSPE